MKKLRRLIASPLVAGVTVLYLLMMLLGWLAMRIEGDDNGPI